MLKIAVLAVCFFLMSIADASAYLGPGLGAGAVAIVIGIVLSLFLGLISVIYYPIKRFLKNRKRGGNGSDFQS